jgi:hypothetical protein
LAPTLPTIGIAPRALLKCTVKQASEPLGFLRFALQNTITKYPTVSVTYETAAKNICKTTRDQREIIALGSGLIGHSQKMTVAASATAEKKTVGQRS